MATEQTQGQPLGLADMSAEEAVAAVSSLQPWLLDAAQAEEEGGKNRRSVMAAIDKQRQAAAPPAAPAAQGAAHGQQGTYGVEDLAAVAQERFGVPGDVVRGAFMSKGVTQMSLEEAQALVAEYAAYRPPVPGQPQVEEEA
jgi:cytochrome c1